MRQDFIIDEGRVKENPSSTGTSDTPATPGTIREFTDPTAEERAELLASCGIDEYDLNSALDPEEVPRVEVEDDYALIIWKRADPASFRTVGLFEVSSVGFVLQKERLTIITAREPLSLGLRRPRAIRSLHELLLRELLEMMRHYIDHLRIIKTMARDVQAKLNMSIGNEHLLRMFSLGESLVYYVNAIEANSGALVRLRASAERLGFAAEETELLDDVVVENAQCGRQAEIYSQVLTGLMDARGNIINNNMNLLLKNLTIINVVFLPLGVLAGIGGMSEFAEITKGIPWWIAYPLFMLVLTAIGFATWRVLERWIDRSLKRL